MIMASFKSTFVATILLYFSYSFLTGCAQQYEYDYSAEARLSNWQSSRTSRTRNGDAPSRFDMKNSSPDLAARNRPRTQIRYEESGIARSQHETTEQNPQQQQSRGRQRTRQRVPETGRTVDRRLDEVTQPAPVTPRRRSSRLRVTTQAPEQLTPRLRVPMEDTIVNQPRSFARESSGRKRVKEATATLETSTAQSPRTFSRGRVKAKIYDTPRKTSSSDTDEISESDNYPPGFVQKIKSSEIQSQQENAGPRRSRIRQRAAKSYPSIAISEANRFRQKYPRSTSTEKPQVTSDSTTTEESATRRNYPDVRQRSRSRYKPPKFTTDKTVKSTRSYSRRLPTTENTNTGYTTTISPRQKYLSRLRAANKQFKSPKVTPDGIVEEEKNENLQSAENSFYLDPSDATTEETKQVMKNLDVELESDASEEDQRIETEKTTQKPTTTTTTTTNTTTLSTINTATTAAVTSATPTAATVVTTTATSVKASAVIPTTRHRFSARFSRSNKTTQSDDVTKSTLESDSLIQEAVTPTPLNLTSLFDDSPDSTLSLGALFNNSFNSSSSVTTNKKNSPENLTNSTTTTSTNRPSTVTESSSTSSPAATTTKRTTKKKSQKKPKKSSKTTTTPSSLMAGLNDRPILRNLVSLLGNLETTTKRNPGKKNSSRSGTKARATNTTTTTTTATTTTTPGPLEIEKILNIINETMEVIQNRTGGPAPARLVPRLALNALTPETSVETTTKPAARTNTTSASNTRTNTITSTAQTTTTTKAPAAKTTKVTATSTKPTTTTKATTEKTTTKSATTTKAPTTSTKPTTTTKATAEKTTTKSATTTKASTTTKAAAAKSTAKPTATTKAPTTTTARTTNTKAPTTTNKTPAASTTTTERSTTNSTSTTTAKSGALSNETTKNNCTSQFVYFDYNSRAPIPHQFREKAKMGTTTTTTQATTTADYFVYGVYPNNTIVRKRAWKTFDYERYNAPYVIFGIYPNNTIVKKFPNGTVINDEFMTSDNEIRDMMGLSRNPTTSTTTTKKPVTTTTTTKKPETNTTTTTTKKPESNTTTTTEKPKTTTTTAKPTTTTAKASTTTMSEMRMAGSFTTQNVIQDVITEEEEDPNSMFEIIENEIEREERKDEDLSSGTTEAATTTVTDGNSLQFEDGLFTTTTDRNFITTEQGSRFLETFESTTTSSRITEVTSTASPLETSTSTPDGVAITTLKSMREGKSFLFNDIFSEEIGIRTTERVTTTTDVTTQRETESDRTGRPSEEIRSDITSTTESPISTTDSTERTTEGNFLQQLFQLTTRRYDSSTPFEFERAFGDGPVYRPSTTGGSSEDVSTTPQSLFSLEGEQLFSTTESPSTTRPFTDSPDDRLVESTTARPQTASNFLSDSYEIDIFGSTTIRGPTTSAVSDSDLVDNSDGPSTSRSFAGNFVDSTTTVAPTASNSLFGISESDLFGSTTTEISTTSGSVFRSSGSTPAASTTTEVPTTSRSLFGLSENSIFGSTPTEAPTTSGNLFGQSGSFLSDSTTTEAPDPFNSLFGLSENSIFGSTPTETPTTSRTISGQSGNYISESTTTESSDVLKSLFGFTTTDPPNTARPVNRQQGNIIESTTAETPTTSGSLFGLSETDLFGSTIEPTGSTSKSGSRFVESTTGESPTTLRSLFGLSEANLFGPTTAEPPISSETPILSSTATEGRNFDVPAATYSNAPSKIDLLSADLFQLIPESEISEMKSTMRGADHYEDEDEHQGLMNLAYKALGSSNIITVAPTPTTTRTFHFVTSTMKSTNFKEKKVKMKMKRASTSTPKPENVFVVTPETTIGDSEYGRKAKVKFVTLTPGVIVTTDIRDGNDIITMSSQHVQKVTKAPANIPDNFLTTVVGEIQKSSSPIPDILKNLEKELQGNGISVSLARRIIEMAIERAVTTEIPAAIGQVRETTMTTPYVTTTRRTSTTTVVNTTPTPYRVESTTSNEVSTAYNELFNTVNKNPSVGFVGDPTVSPTTKRVNEDDINRLVQGLWKEQTQTTTVRTTTKSSKRGKSSRNPAASTTALSQNDKLLLEAILKQQNSNLTVQELDRIIENQIRLAEEVRKASKNMRKKPRVTTTTTTTTTTQTPPLFGFLISLFSGQSSPSNIPVSMPPTKQTRSRLKSSRVQGSMTKNTKKPDPLNQSEEGNPSGERSSRGELVTAAIDVTKAVSKFMGTFLSSAAQSFQAFFTNFGRGR